jgi:C-terminal processing protease CtpA/Prc
MGLLSPLLLCAAEPATRPSDQEILDLIVQMGDLSPDVRDRSQRLLREIGEPAVPLLQRARDRGDGEIAVRAAALIKVIGRSQLPGGLLSEPVQAGSEMDALGKLWDSVYEELFRKRIPAEQRQAVTGEFAAVLRLRTANVLESAPQPEKRLHDYFQASDRLRASLQPFDLDLGPYLAPPANARLGVQIAFPDGADGQVDMVVQTVVPDSLAARLGLQPGDVLLEVNGIALPRGAETDSTDRIKVLREAVASRSGGQKFTISRAGQKLEIMEVSRAGQKLEIREERSPVPAVGGSD